MEKKKIVFLYSELASYFISCVEKLLEYQNVEIHIVKWQVNKEAPFNFSFSKDLYVYNREDYAEDQLKELIMKISPSVLYTSGWMDKGYLKICKSFKNRIPVIVGFDNHWKGTFRQQIARILSPFRILNHFSHCWVPGPLQKEYALKLGFKENAILTGFYSCNYDLFHAQYLKNAGAKKASFPKRFIYVGRYVEHKGITDLWKAFIELQEEHSNEWELWCLGTGDLAPLKHPKIKHAGFIQPSEMIEFVANTGVFVLPSHFEPWGVVVHEFAAAGFPLICTDEVGARFTFVENGYNGYIYPAGDVSALKKILAKIIDAGSEELVEMGDRSAIKAGEITPRKWAEQLMSVV
jgi:glycosyltransferase involved in cell wall biosynthesis